MAWLRRILNTFRVNRQRRDIEREIAFHLAERADDLRAEGAPDAEASRRARLQFGNPAVQYERTRDVMVSVVLDGWLRSMRLAVRTLRRTPAFTATVVLTLALGIGANTAVFSALHMVVLRPLPFPEADRLVQVTQTQDRDTETNVAPVRLQDWARLSTSFDALTGYTVDDVSDTTGAIPQRVRRATVAPLFLETWGVAPVLGRGFSEAEHRFGGPRVLLISDRYWRTRFDADPDVLQRTVRIGDVAYRVVGVMRRSFLFPDPAVDLWEPHLVDAPYAQSREARWHIGIGRLAADVTIDAARAELALVQSQLGTQYPDTDRTIGTRIVPLKDVLVGHVRSSLWLLYGAVSVLLAIACMNIAALLLARSARRQHEVAVRYSLGASRAAVAGQMLSEAGVLALAGAACGLFVAAAGTGTLRQLAPGLPRVHEIAVNASLLGYTMAAAVIVACLCGLLPALRSASGVAVLNTDSRTQVSTRHRTGWLLVGVQVALSVVLLTGAGLLLRSFDALSRVDPGFDGTHVLAFRVSGEYGEPGGYEALVQRINRTLDELRALPGVEAVATTDLLPGGASGRFEAELALVEGRAATEPQMVAEVRTVSPGYFQTLRIPLLEGELCDRPAGPVGTTQVMVNRRFVDRYVAGRSAIGLHLAANSPDRIMGIVGDARESGVSVPPAPTVYQCFSAPVATPWFLVRTRGEPLALAAAVRGKMQELEPLRSVYDVARLDAWIGDTYADDRLATFLLTVFATAALLLASLGIYGTLSYVVSLRRREVGLRLALGASRRDVARQVFLPALRLVALACGAGLALSLASSRLLSGMLYGVSPTDPATLASVLGVVLVVAGLTALVPATRAAFVEPVDVLRE